ncbi:glycerophosphoryl diester phosphodiesterase [Advenella sp. S44]|uniref:esterase-like activity of phytase family protein n=1 Tax=Advenella sp. S44 TaxID=1982755 RepID=UPI000C2AE447|nr:esterase-like activity of phytase family protein [Advenella sp. S44]PJX20462.1 glycerophosphoryl diester phosphodiesterase [Advenella sp. S44]
MTIRFRFSTIALALGLATITGLAQAQTEVPAVLEGHAVLPASSTIPAPKNAPEDLEFAGKYTTGNRVEQLASVMGKSNGRHTGISLPIQGQPLQGHSGIQVMKDGSVWILTDNGSGNKANSPDSMLYLNQYKIDWKSGKFEHIKSVFLSDPDKNVPFRIVHEGTTSRYLTGSDFDPESFQIIGDTLWIGEEFGPFLIKADLEGKVQAIFETQIDGRKIQSPDHYQVATPGAPNASYKDVNLKRSKGYEGMAASADGKFLYPLLEGPVWDDSQKTWETADGKTVLRMLEFDVAAEKWTGRHWLYPLEAEHHAIGDFNMIDATTGLIIERDNGEGTPDKACKQGGDTQSCFSDLPKFKRVYKVEFGPQSAGKAVRKVAYIDLLNIADPSKVARKPLTDGVLQFPFFTIENVDIVDSEHIIVGNDNNFPFSSSREPNKQDDNELILLKTPELLQAK